MNGQARRIAALERDAEGARAARIAAQEEQARQAGRLMPRRALKDMVEWMNEWERDPERAQRIHASVFEIARPLDLPGAEAARAWGEAVDTLPEDGTLPTPPAGTADYWTAEAEDWERALYEEASGTEEMRTAARWHAAEFRYYAALARTVGGEQGGPVEYGREQENFAWRLLFKLPSPLGRNVRGLGDGPGMEKLYGGYRQVELDFPPGEVSEALAVAAYRAAWGEE